jgi:penicillin G amidase
MKRETLTSRLGRLLLWLTAVLLLIVAGAALVLEQTLPRQTGTVRVAGLRAPAEIGRDSMGVVTIRAEGEADAAFALGYAHAQDRLFQMDLTRRLGAGRLSEVVGASALRTDEFMRRLGLYRVAEANYKNLPADVQALFQAYAAGVNAYLARRGGLLAPEFMLLRYRPEPWRPADSIVWGRLMAWQLSENWDDERLRQTMADHLTAQELDWIWPIAQRLTRRGDLPWIPAGGASNNWVVAGKRTATGKPLLANDPHLGLELPGTWYLARLEIGKRVLAGATAPGVPAIIIGRNDHVAWGFTTAYADTQDLFVETLLDGDRYVTPEGPRPLIRRQEVIRVKGAAPVILEVAQTRHGPIIETDAAHHRGYALAWTGLRPDDRTGLALVTMNRAGSADEFREALRDFESPVQNAVFADDTGNIGYIMAGRIPIRAQVKDESEAPVPGDRRDYDWIGVIPFDHLPQGMNAPAGYFATANNRTMAPDYPYFIGGKFDFDYRIRRIRQLIAATPHHGLDSMEAIQLDTFSPAAQELLPLMLAVQSDPDLATWDLRMDRDAPEPLIFTAWLRELAHVLLDSRTGDAFSDVWFWDAPLVADALKGKAAAGLCDDPKTPAVEDCAGDIRLAYKQAIAKLTAAYGPDRTNWRWGNAHRARFPNPLLSRIPLVAAWVDLALPTDGDNFTLNRASPRVDDPTGARFDDVHGASLRAIFDLADLDRSRFVIAGGQSGNPFSAHYADFAALWRDGQYVTMVGSESNRLRLLPEVRP